MIPSFVSQETVDMALGIGKVSGTCLFWSVILMRLDSFWYFNFILSCVLVLDLEGVAC